MDREGASRVGVIIDGPIPTARGDVTFGVQVGSEVIPGYVSPLGIGAPATDIEVMNAVMRAVAGYEAVHRAELQGLYREAARLRRAAGHAPLAGNTRPGRFVVAARPIRRGELVLFETAADATHIRMMFGKDGGFSDTWYTDDPDETCPFSQEDADDAATACLDYIFSHRTEAIALGLDVDLLEELWR